MRCRPWLLSCFVVAACQLQTVAPEPLRGKTPRTILIAPPAAGDALDPAVGAQLLDGAEAALRARGYHVLPLVVGLDLLRQFGLDASTGAAPGSLQRIRQVTGADAVLRVEAREFRCEQGRVLESARYVLRWQLVQSDGGELWSYELAGSYARPLDPGGAAAPVPADERPVQPFGVPPPQRPFRDVGDLLRNLHAAAMAHLPEGGT